MTFKNGKHTMIALFYVHNFSHYVNVGGTNENNRSYLKNNRYIGENNKANF